LDSGVRGIEVGTDVCVAVGTGVMGEIFFGLPVPVGSDVEMINVGNIRTCCGGAGVGVASSVQAVIKTQIRNAKIHIRFITSKYIQEKLSGDEIYATLLP
jgi:hypothetical protein